VSRHPVPSFGLDPDLSDEVQREHCKGMLEAWIASKALKVLHVNLPLLHRAQLTGATAAAREGALCNAVCNALERNH